MKNFFENTLLFVVLGSVILALYAIPAAQASSNVMAPSDFYELWDSETPVCLIVDGELKQGNRPFENRENSLYKDCFHPEVEIVVPSDVQGGQVTI